MKFESQYSFLDKLLHRASFASGALQVDIAGVENRIFAARLEACPVERPVFVTALPRAGTTVLLNLLAGTGEFATHIYRDMPFVLCPMLWHRFARLFYREARSMERAHDDGLQVSVESPEALEEIVWKAFWKEHYQRDCIRPWTTCNASGFRQFFLAHMRKIVALRSADAPSVRRYASKNNLNIARIAALPAMLPDSTVIVPFRHPLQQAASLHNQHRRFLDMHGEDDFSRRYMEGTGHYDFGANLRPVDFDGWLHSRRSATPLELAFWLEYWVSAYRHILERGGASVHLLSFDGMAEQPGPTLEALADVLDLSASASLTGQSGSIAASPGREVDTAHLPAGLADSAMDLYAALRSKALGAR